MPAQSPTLSPTLSAITAGFLGSSSGMSFSTLPTRSAPTSAPLVNIPPPSLAKIEIKDEPNPKATSGSISSLPLLPKPKYKRKKYPAIPASAKPTTKSPVTAPALNATYKPFFKDELDA